jgi:hypothetical protein
MAGRVGNGRNDQTPKGVEDQLPRASAWLKPGQLYEVHFMTANFNAGRVGNGRNGQTPKGVEDQLRRASAWLKTGATV